jgi:hypothetical protein
VFACEIAEPDAGTPADSGVDDALSLDAVPPGEASVLDGPAVDGGIPSDASYSADTGLVAEVGATADVVDGDVFAMDARPTPGGGCAMAGGADHRRAFACWPILALGLLLSRARKGRLHVRGQWLSTQVLHDKAASQG